MVPVVATAVMYLVFDRPLDGVGRAALIVTITALIGRAGLTYTVNAALRQALTVAANQDRLTGLPNRRAFERQLADRLESERTAIVIFCDVDGFKEINDTGGHQSGDAVLVEVGRRLSEVLGEQNVWRLAGDEFTAILPSNTSADELTTALARARDRVAEPIEFEGRLINVTLSAGVSLADGFSASEVMKHADLALHESKRRGRNMFLIYEAEMSAAVDRRFRVGQELADVLANDRLHLAYQPIRDLRHGALRAEALLRFTDESGTPIASPSLAVEVAHELGLAADLGRATLRAAIRQMAEWMASGLPVNLSVNLSAEQVLGVDVPRCIRTTCAEYGIDPSSLTVEITEAILSEEPAVVAQLNRLRSIGVRISLDDFGTGYSNFASLIELPIDELKLDQGFLMGNGEAARRRLVVSSMLKLAKDLGLAVTIEGVETQAQFDLAIELGVDFVQGHLISRPVAASEVAFAFATVDLNPTTPGL